LVDYLLLARIELRAVLLAINGEAAVIVDVFSYIGVQDCFANGKDKEQLSFTA